MFTYRDFEGGTLGLAWTGDLKNAGGVCEKHGVRQTEMMIIISNIFLTLFLSPSTTAGATRVSTPASSL